MSEGPKRKIWVQVIYAAGCTSTGNEKSFFLNVLMGKILTIYVQICVCILFFFISVQFVGIFVFINSQ